MHVFIQIAQYSPVGTQLIYSLPGAHVFLNGLSLIPAWASNDTPRKGRVDIIYPYSNFNACTLGNLIPRYTMISLLIHATVEICVEHVKLLPRAPDATWECFTFSAKAWLGKLWNNFTIKHETDPPIFYTPYQADARVRTVRRTNRLLYIPNPTTNTVWYGYVWMDSF